MSDRGSWITDYIYDQEVLERLAADLEEKGFKVQVLFQGSVGGRLAGAVSDLYSNGELEVFEHEILPILAAPTRALINVVCIAEAGGFIAAQIENGKWEKTGEAWPR